MPRLVSQIVDVYVYRIVNGGPAEFLVLKRADGALLGGTWQAVHGHIRPGETAVQAAVRETFEEAGLRIEALHQLESVNTFFIARQDAIHLCPSFAARVVPDAEVTLNEEHTAYDWLSPDAAISRLMWPGQRHAIAEIQRDVLPGGAAAEALRVLP